MTTAISVKNLGKQYKIGAAQTKFDDKTGVRAESNPWEVFQFGYSAYKNGHKDQAAEAYRYASEGFIQFANAITVVILVISIAATLLANQLQAKSQPWLKS